MQLDRNSSCHLHGASAELMEIALHSLCCLWVQSLNDWTLDNILAFNNASITQARNFEILGIEA